MFDQLVVAVGHFSVPNMPKDMPFLDTFSGFIMHSRDLRDFNVFKNKRVLLIGSGLSAEDIACQMSKFGASQIIISHRKKNK